MSESQESEAVIRRWLDAWSQDAIDVFLDFYDSDAELIRIDADVFITSVNEVERGKIQRQEWYFDLTDALKAVGLRSRRCRRRTSSSQLRTFSGAGSTLGTEETSTPSPTPSMTTCL